MRYAFLLFVLGCASGPQTADADGFVPLFNGKDLTGWVRVNCAPETFRVHDGTIITTGVPTGVMRTDRMYENYVVEFDWMHRVPKGNSGFFIHSGALPAKGVPFTKGHEIQVLDGDSPDGTWTGHGDVFSIHGASFVPDRPHPKGWMRCLPSEKRANPAGQWNHYRVEVNDGSVKLSVNGKEVSGGTRCKPRKGYICLESEGSECHFKNLRIKELPSTSPPADEVAEADQGFTSLYSGLDLRGWNPTRSGDGRWTAKDWVLDYAGKEPGELWTQADYGDIVLTFDWRVPGQNVSYAPAVGLGGGVPLSAKRLPLKPAAKAREWMRAEIRLEKGRITVLQGDKDLPDDQMPPMPERGRLVLRAPGPMQFANIFIKELR